MSRKTLIIKEKQDIDTAGEISRYGSRYRQNNLGIIMMSRKKLIILGMVIGSVAGGYAPLLFGADDLMLSIIGSTAGGLLGIWLGYKLSE